jgi:hypothetical protein
MIGWPRGAFNRFSMENWGNSYKNACRFINETAAPNSTVLAMMIPDIPRFYLRPDGYQGSEAEICQCSGDII